MEREEERERLRGRRWSSPAGLITLVTRERERGRGRQRAPSREKMVMTSWVNHVVGK